MRLKVVKSILWFIYGVGTITGASRFIFGLGATTNLTDTTPWGLWIGFDVMAGVALAAGGFVIAATVYIFKLEKFRPIVRAAVLTAFLGYLAVAVGLLFDLGLPWNIWHMMIFWNPHSPLFEVGWCVMLYLAVLTLEFMPVVLEKFPKFEGLYKLLKKWTIPLVIIGIGLSTLHQSSLGSLLLIMPYRIHPLWYSPIIPVLFLISAVALGLMMVTLESTISSWLYRKKHETNILAGLGKAAVWVLSAYIIVRLVDLAVRGNFGLIFDGSWESAVFIIELFISAIIPASILSISKVRNSRAGLAAASFMTVSGIVLHRINASGVSQIRVTGTDYFPSLIEISISLWVVSGAILVFMFFVERFKVFEHEADEKEWMNEIPKFDRSSVVWTNEPVFGSLKRYSLMFVSGAVIAFMFLPLDARTGPHPLTMPVQRAQIADVLLINGNRNEQVVVFDHELHKSRNGMENSCVLCHHMRKPFDKYTPCADCHSDMQKATFIFDHSLHKEKLGDNEACIKCHVDPHAIKTMDNTKECSICHTEMRITDSVIELSAGTKSNYAPGYKDSMHGLCLKCHSKKKTELNLPRMDECAQCHRPLPDDLKNKIDKLYGLKTTEISVVPNN
ncbi:NrfD/PsrC family molybdoenzyme membrane anchor subunit [candidate division KSB1 bacterium]